MGLLSMPDEALYVYGIVKSGFELEWKKTGIEGKNVYTVSEYGFGALVHDCEEKPYMSEDPNKIKELIIAHNRILDRAINHFDGVIPLHFNTIIKKGENSSQDNIKKWLNDNKERLENTWDKIEGREEYGIRMYYDKEKLIEEVSNSEEIKDIETNREGKGAGLSYLLQSKAKTKINEIGWDKVNEL